MTAPLPIDEVVRRTGLTSRTLRFYESRGLIAPLRTGSGRRWFGPEALERIHHIVALKKAGLSLADIRRLFDRRPIDLGALLAAQRDRLARQAEDIAGAMALIDSALARIDRGEPLDAATLCSLIRDGGQRTNKADEVRAWQDILDRYHTAEEQAAWRERIACAPDHDPHQDLARWRDLAARIEAALPLDPESEAALGFVREWFALLEPFSRQATPEMWDSARRMYDDLDRWEGEVDAAFGKRVWDFINAATQAARAAGKDIGPVPAWLQPSAKGEN